METVNVKLSATVNSLLDDPSWGLVYEISESGLRFAATQEYRLGQTLSLALTEAEQTVGTVPVTVANAEYHAGVGWLVTCRFHGCFDENTPLAFSWPSSARGHLQSH
jgi:hypothetical protein